MAEKTIIVSGRHSLLVSEGQIEVTAAGTVARVADAAADSTLEQRVVALEQQLKDKEEDSDE